MKLIKLIVIFSLIVFFSNACTQDTENDYDENRSYWSINHFIMDQYQMMLGEPLVVKQVVKIGEKIDSSFTPIDELDWATVIKIFGETDISNPKFYGNYKFDNFDDNFMEMSTMTYTAIKPDLFVQKININYDNLSRKVSMVYIETNDDGWFHEKQQKLTYHVGSKIIIQESEKSKFSKDKEVLITYEF